MRKLTLIGWGALLLAIASFSNLPAQEVVAHIRGTVTDPSGAGVPGAEVKATNTQTQVSTTVTTRDDGNYEFLALPPGTYDVTVTKQGFRTFTAHRITLALNQVYNLQVPLEVGEVTQSVQVEASPTQVETATTQLSTIIDGKQIVDLPLVGRNWTSLQQLVPGVVASSDRFGVGGNYASNGSESQQNSFLINGSDAMDFRLNAPLIIPSPDALGEFNFITSTINPEYGRNSGGILNAVIKSGTNQFHGSAFEFYRDTFLNTHNFFQSTIPVFHQNEYGGTVGGPIWKDHTFFFLSYQGRRSRSPDTNATSNTTTVFSDAQRAGFFPSIVGSTGVSAIPLVGESGATYAAGTPYSTLFPTGHIPTQDFNSLSQALLNKYVPRANLGSSLFTFNPIQTVQDEQGIARVDHTFGNKDMLWVSLFFDDIPVTHDLPFLGSTLPGFPEGDPETEKMFTADWTHTFSPTTLNEFRVSYERFNYQAVTPINSALPSSFGFTGITPEFPNNAGMPYVNVIGYFNLGQSPFGPQPAITNTYQLHDDFSKVVGSHTLKFGFDGRRYQVYNPYEAFNNGDFTFGATSPYTTGDAGADFLLGLPDSYNQQSGGVQDFRTYEYYMYAQDTWKATQTLTLNLGVGYQIDTPLENLHFNKLDMNCFRPGQQSSVFPTAPKGLLFPGDNGCSLSGYYQHNDHIGPRFGFAYAPNWGSLSGGSAQKFVIRGGFGVYFNKMEEEIGLQQLSAAPFSLAAFGAASAGGSPAFANPYKDVAGGASAPNPFPFTPPTKGQAVDFSQFLPLDINVVNPNFTNPYAMNFNLNIQREMPGAMLLQVGYVGALGRHLTMVYEGNPISPAGQAACAADPACIADRANQHIDYPSHAAFAPGDVFASVGTQASTGVSNYNSLQVQLQKRLTHGLMFQASYTWSHSIDDTSGYEGSGAAPGLGRAPNPYNFASYRGDSTFDARHRFVINYDYEVPSFTKLWNNPISKYVLSGWRVGGITTFQTGFPVIVGDSGFRSLTCDQFVYYACWDAPNVVGFPGIYDPRDASLVNTSRNPANKTVLSNYYFNPNAFTLAPFGVIGNAGRNNFHGPGINNTDLILVKEINFTESRKIELRLESYNTFNHTQFRFSSNILSYQNIESSTFGRTLTAAPGRIIQLGAKIYF